MAISCFNLGFSLNKKWIRRGIGGKVSGFAALFREIATGLSALAMTWKWENRAKMTCMADSVTLAAYVMT